MHVLLIYQLGSSHGNPYVAHVIGPFSDKDEAIQHSSVIKLELEKKYGEDYECDVREMQKDLKKSLPHAYFFGNPNPFTG
jgi:hypothetical protein